jgi:hypothetical protein
MTNVLDVGNAIDDLTSDAETKPKPAEKAAPTTDCRYCSKTFTGGARFVQRGLHEKREHPTEWAQAKAGVKPKKKTAKKAPAAKKPAASGPVSAAKGKRIPAAEPISQALGLMSQVIVRADPPVGRALQFCAPATGEAIDELIAGTFVDKKVVQPFAGVADKWEKVGGIIAFPVLIAVVSHNPALFGPLEDQLRSATVDVINSSIPTLEKKRKRERQAAESLRRLGEVDERYANSPDPILLILQDIFNPQVPDGPTE